MDGDAASSFRFANGPLHNKSVAPATAKPDRSAKVLYTLSESADKFVFDYVIRHSNASSAGIKKMGFGPPLYVITQVSSTIQPQQKMKTKNMKTLNLKNSISRSPWRGSFLLIPLLMAGFALLPMAQAETISEAETISPLAGAELPGFNTELGFNALDNLGAGIFNSGFGAFALEDTTSGSHNTALGGQALRNNTLGSYNTAVGENALVFNIDGVQNMALGQGALANNLHGDNNTAMGFQALNVNTTDGNTAVGFQALRLNTTGANNVATGFQPLFGNTTGEGNNAFGDTALTSNATGDFNNAFGTRALFATTGDNNTAVGDDAGRDVSTGSGNVFIGASAGPTTTTASRMIIIGSQVICDLTSNHTFIGQATGGNQQTACFIGGIFGRTISAGTATQVGIDSSGKLGTMVVSSERFKRDIKPMDNASEALLSFKPVTFHYKDDAKNTPCFGLIAEEVAKVNPDLVVHDQDGELLTVRYEAVNAMLLNEFLKEHRKNEEQEKRIDALTAQLKEQAAQIQKVSAQVEVSKPAQQTVSNK